MADVREVRALRRALRELALCHPRDFEMLLARQRAAEGLCEPDPNQRTIFDEIIEK